MSERIEDEANRLPRRDFLKMGVALPLAFSPLAEMLAANSASASGVVPPVAIGYQAVGGASILNATLLRQGDALFQRTGAKVKVEGYCPGWQPDSETWETNIVSIQSFLHFYPALPGNPEVRIPAWSFEIQTLKTGDRVTNAGAPVCMNMPLSPDGTLTLSLIIRSTTAEQTNAVIRLTTGRQGGMAKLLQGGYVIAGASQSTGLLPDWKSGEWAAALNGNGGNIPTRENAAGPDFPYLILHVQRALQQEETQIPATPLSEN